jgi:hypothetical protein
VALGCAISFAVVQSMFERADHRKAVELVRGFRGAGGQTIEDLVARGNPGARADGAWSSEILSGCRGFVRVRCRPLGGGDFAFDVDLVRKGIHPGNEAGRAILAQLDGQ